MPNADEKTLQPQDQVVATPRDAWMLSELNDKQILVRKTPQGTFRPVAAAVTLYEAKGQIAPVGTIENDDSSEGSITTNFMRTCLGYQAYNRIANLTIITPDKIYMDGFDRPCPNPYLEIDGSTGMVNRAVCKKLCVGFGPLGNVVITSVTVSFNPKAALIKDLFAKFRADSRVGHLMSRDDAAKLGPTFWSFPLDGELVLAVSLGHPSVLKAFNTFLRTKDFTDRRVQTVAERIVFSKHPAMPQGALRNLQGTKGNHVCREVVYGFIHDLTREELQEAAEAADRGEEPVVRGQKAQTIEVPAGAHEDEDLAPELEDLEEGSL